MFKSFLVFFDNFLALEFSRFGTTLLAVLNTTKVCDGADMVEEIGADEADTVGGG